MSDYIEEINTALSVRNAGFYFESMDDVVRVLEHERDGIKEDVLTYGGVSGVLGAGGVFYETNNDFAVAALSPLQELMSADEISRFAAVGMFALAAIPAYVSKRRWDKYREVQDIVDTIEETDNPDEDLDPYKIAECLVDAR